MIFLKANTIPKKFENVMPQVKDFLSSIRQVSHHDIRMYCDYTTGIIVDGTINKILWEDDLTFSMAIVMSRLRALNDFWSYEKGIIKIKTEDDVIRYHKLKKKFKYE